MLPPLLLLWLSIPWCRGAVVPLPRRQRQHVRFHHWLLHDANVSVHPSVQFITTGDRGVVSTTSLSSGTTVASIPLASCIGATAARQSLPNSPMYNEYSDFVVLAMFLHRVRTASVPVHWSPFVDWMSVPNSPMLWSNADLNRHLNNTFLRQEILKRKDLTAHIAKDLDTSPTALLWGMAMVQSRVHSVPQYIDGNWTTTKMLVPFADALNTGADVNVVSGEWRWWSGGGVVVVGMGTHVCLCCLFLFRSVTPPTSRRILSAAPSARWMRTNN
jgi:hypothetical protein